jgi:hypothetical protein
VGGIEFDDDGEIFDGDFYLLEFLIGTADDVVGADVTLVEVEEAVAVLDGLLEHAFLHVGAGADEEGLAVGGVEFEAGGADADQTVDVYLVAVEPRGLLGRRFRVEGAAEGG